MADSDAKWTMLCFCHYATFVYLQYMWRFPGLAYICMWVCVYLCIRLSELSSTPNGLMGTLWCLSSPLEWDTLRVWRSTKAQPCLWRGVSLWRGATAVLTVAGLMVITLPRGSALWTLKPRTSPLHTPLSCHNRGSKHTPVDHRSSVALPDCRAIHPAFSQWVHCGDFQQQWSLQYMYACKTVLN